MPDSADLGDLGRLIFRPTDDALTLDRVQQARASALIAASHLTAPNSRPNVDDLEIWRRHVLTMADKFTDYILFGQNREDSPT
jgi:hypothetical protein